MTGKKKLGKSFWLWLDADEEIDSAVSFLDDALRELEGVESNRPYLLLLPPFMSDSLDYRLRLIIPGTVKFIKENDSGLVLESDLDGINNEIDAIAFAKKIAKLLRLPLDLDMFEY